MLRRSAALRGETLPGLASMVHSASCDSRAAPENRLTRIELRRRKRGRRAATEEDRLGLDLEIIAHASPTPERARRRSAAFARDRRALCKTRSRGKSARRKECGRKDGGRPRLPLDVERWTLTLDVILPINSSGALFRASINTLRSHPTNILLIRFLALLFFCVVSAAFAQRPPPGPTPRSFTPCTIPPRSCNTGPNRRCARDG